MKKLKSPNSSQEKSLPEDKSLVVCRENHLDKHIIRQIPLSIWDKSKNNKVPKSLDKRDKKGNSMLSIKEWQKEIHQCAKDHGWWETERNFPEMLCLIHSEISEALEGYIKGDDENIKEELADAVIRILDLCEHMGFDLELEISKKHTYNLTRPYRHGGKKC